MLNAFIQDVAEQTPELDPETTEKTLSIIELVVNGGTASMIIIGTLAILLFVALYVYFERLFAIKAASKYDANFMNQIRDNVASGNLQAAKVLCAQKRTPVSRLTEKGISRIGSPLDDINTAVVNTDYCVAILVDKTTNKPVRIECGEFTIELPKTFEPAGADV